MFKIMSVFVLSVLIMTSLPALAQSDSSFFPSVCRVNESGNFRVTIESASSVPILVQWVLDWNVFTDFLEGEFWIDPEHRIEMTIKPSSETSQLAFFLMTDAGWIGVYEFTLDESTPLCSQDNDKPEPGCDQFMPISANSVQITLASDTELLWYPDVSAGIGLEILAGQTAWMIGSQDGYAEIVWSCDLLWVSLDTVKMD